MLVANNKGSYTKKATGRITYICTEGDTIAAAVQKTITTGEGETLWLKSVGYDKQGDQVSEMHFEWSIKLKV
jgi:hypothetical protein